MRVLHWQELKPAELLLITLLAAIVILAVLKYTIGIRVSEEVEVEGLDINLHGEVVQG